MFLGQFMVAPVSLQKHDEIGNFFMFLKTNEGYLSQIALKNMQFLVNYTFHEPTFIVSYLGAFLAFDQLSKATILIHNINIAIVD